MSSSARPGATLFLDDYGAKLNFENDYALNKKLRSGSYGVVWTTQHKTTNEEFAVKVIDRTKLKKKDDDATFREIDILKDLVNVENIVRLVDIYVDPQTFYVVQILAKGGDVFDRLAQRTAYTEKDARDLGVVLLQTMKELHSRKICHRDMKPENLLLRNKVDDIGIMVADFGFAKYVPEEGLKTRCGTPAFVAPEILVGKNYNQQADMWSVGCLLYMLIGGYPPFQDESHRGLFRKIRAADYTFHDIYWKNVSLHAKQLISKLLTVDPGMRLDCDESLMTTWLEVKPEHLSSRDLSGSIGEIKKFNAKRKLKSAMHAVVWSIGTPFRHAKVSDLLKAADKNDETTQPPEAPTQNTKFSMSMTNKKKFEEVYELGTKIHRGSFAIVKECLHREWKQKYAVKIVERSAKTDEAVLHEVAVMNQLDHQHIVKVVDFFEEADFYYVVMELMAGGDVFDRIIDMTTYTESDARDLAKILLEGVEYMHKHGIAHRDLKPQNLLLESKENNSVIKLADFGFAKRVHTPKSLTSKCGTPSYVAPEILKGIPYDQSCDMWSVGVILYVMLCGYTPFADDNQNKMFERIKQGDWEFEDEDWNHISQDAKDLITSLLTANPEKRATATQAIRSKWINEDASLLSERDLSESLRIIKEKRPRLKDLARAFMALKSSTKNALKDLNPIHAEHDSGHQLI